MLTSGDTAKATVSDAVIDLLANPTAEMPRKIIIVKEDETNPGFFSIDGGRTWGRMPAKSLSVTVELDHKPIAPVVQFKRPAGGANVTGLWAWAY